MLSEVTGIPLDQIDVTLPRKHLIYHSVYYAEMEETERYEEEIHGSAKTLSGLGGQMGISLGASFSSLFQIIWLGLTEICKQLFQIRNRHLNS